MCSLIQAIHVNGELTNEFMTGNLKVFGEVKENSLTEKIGKQFITNSGHCPAPDLPIFDDQVNQPGDLASQAIDLATQNLGRRKFRRSGRQLRYYL